mmetsp:Transcript_10195/g.22073  ORF Transcript_10195/g.22073 Transcript_10195/m.22073 type:complete len:121 (-) Transcript_10195:434-796(-)
MTTEEVGETITTKSLHKKGVYKEIEQDSRADLAFRSDGTVTGKGFDYIDVRPLRGSRQMERNQERQIHGEVDGGIRGRLLDDGSGYLQQRYDQCPIRFKPRSSWGGTLGVLRSSRRERID